MGASVKRAQKYADSRTAIWQFDYHPWIKVVSGHVTVSVLGTVTSRLIIKKAFTADHRGTVPAGDCTETKS
jgi:hypothetical protein